MNKNCFNCGSKIVRKDGVYGQKQRYKCAACGKRFVGGERINNQDLWHQYTQGKQTYEQLSLRYKCSQRTIRRRLDKITPQFSAVAKREVIALMDTTYFGRGFGVMLFKDAISGLNLYKIYVKTETNALYLQGIEHLKQREFTIRAIVCDGRRVLFQLFSSMPMQMCSFNQTAIIRRYLTKKPKMQASKELWS